jgi:hypothetical protein
MCIFSLVFPGFLLESKRCAFDRVATPGFYGNPITEMGSFGPMCHKTIGDVVWRLGISAKLFSTEVGV